MRQLFKYTFLITGLCTLGVTLAVLIPLSSAPLVGIKRDYAITHINIVSTISGDVLEDMTVLIEKGRILEIVPSNEHQADPKYFVISGRDKYLLPGLWDMHTHSLKLSPQLHHPLFIRYGVTSIRDMSGCLNKEDSYWACPGDRVLWEKQAISGERVSPRYPLQSSYQTNGGTEVPEDSPAYFRLTNSGDAQQLVDFYSAEGVDFIKTYTELTLDQYDNLTASSTQRGIDIAGHKPISISLTHALEAGMKSIEHGRLFMFECFKDIEAFRRLDDPISHYNAQFIREMLENQNLEKCKEEMEAMANSETSWVPTLTTLKMSAEANDESFRQDSRLEYIPFVVRKLLWEQDIGRASSQGYDQQGNFVHADFYASVTAQIKEAKRLGVNILAGTDNIDTYVFTGSSIHDELAMLVESGLTPLEAIQSATINPARFAEMDHELGSVAIDRQADFLLVNENPLLDIRNTADIYGVMFSGQYFDQEALNALDQYAISSARSLRVNMQFLYNLLASPLMRVQLMD